MNRPQYVEGDPRELKLLDVNAQYMTHEQFARLVSNVKRDGYLSSVPLVYRDPDTGEREVESGNHRVKAAIEAGLPTIGWLEISWKMTRQQLVATQLSHNHILGQADPATLKRLYDELDDIDWRSYSGLDDATLKLLAEPGTGGFGEANLDYATVSLVFLPTELEEARAAFDAARKAASSDAYLLASFSQHDAALDALASVHSAAKVGNVATAFGIILGIFERHIGELSAEWFDPETGLPLHKGQIPAEVLLGGRRIAGDQAAVIHAAIQKVIRNGDADTAARALELICADAIAGMI